MMLERTVGTDEGTELGLCLVLCFLAQPFGRRQIVGTVVGTIGHLVVEEGLQGEVLAQFFGDFAFAGRTLFARGLHTGFHA